jgi:glycosyltransferase involved in cell wall biosynthesis
MRILMLAQFYPPILGGTEQYVRALSIELVARGYDVAVATIWHEGLAHFEIDEGVRIHRIRSSMQRIPWLFGDARRHAPPFPDPELTLELQRVMQKEQPDIVHAHNWLVRSFLPLKMWNKTRLIISLHDYSLVCAKQALMYHDTPCSGPGFAKCIGCAASHYGSIRGIPTVLSNQIMGRIERGAADMFLAVSQAVAENNGLVGSNQPFQVIPNFIDRNIGDDTHMSQEDTSAYLAQLPDEGYILYVGAFLKEKGVEVVLNAYTGLVDHISSTTDQDARKIPPLVLIGYQTAGWQVPIIDNDSTHKIFVFKDWPHSAVIETWKRCSMALIPSIWSEPFGIVALEAMSMGKPIIASRIGGLSDIVVDKETGFLLPPGDEQALQEAIQHLLDNPEQRERMGKMGKHRVQSFQTETVVPRIEQAYRDVIASASKRL